MWNGALREALNSHVWVAIKSILRSRTNIYLASPRSKNLTFAVLYVLFMNCPYNSVENCDVFHQRC
jgi:hypothetical protein